MVKRFSVTVCCIVLISAVLSELSVSPHGGVLYFIWGKYYYVHFTPLFVYYLIVISLLWYVFYSLSIKKPSLLRKSSFLIAVVLLGVIFSFSSAVVPYKVNNYHFAYARGFPFRFYLPTESHRIFENLSFFRHQYGNFPAYYLFPKPQEYTVTILKCSLILDTLFYSVLVLVVLIIVKRLNRSIQRNS